MVSKKLKLIKENLNTGAKRPADTVGEQSKEGQAVDGTPSCEADFHTQPEKREDRLSVVVHIHDCPNQEDSLGFYSEVFVEGFWLLSSKKKIYGVDAEQAGCLARHFICELFSDYSVVAPDGKGLSRDEIIDLLTPSDDDK